MKAAQAWLRAQPVAHRGLHDDVLPENSIAACEAAVAAGYAIEIDVHRTRHGELVVFHDDTLVRMTGLRGTTAMLTPSQRQRARLLGTSNAIPRLDEVLACVDGRVPLLVELKSSRDAGPLARSTAAAIAGYRGPLALQSFDPHVLVALRELAVPRPLGLLSCDFATAEVGPLEAFVLRRLLLAPWVRPDFVAYELGALPYWPATWARRLGLPLLAWTITDAAQLERARCVADNVIFERVRPR